MDTNIDNRQRSLTYFVVLVTSFILPYAGTALTVAIPSIGLEFRSSAVTLGWVMTSYMLITVAFAVPFGKLADLYGKRLILILGLIIFVGFHMLAAVIANAMWVLILCRMGMAFGAAMLFATNLAILADVFPPEIRGKALGTATAVTFAGISAGPVIGGLITEHFGWRGVLFSIGLVGLAMIVVSIVGLPKSAAGAGAANGEKRGNLNPPNTLLFIGAVSLVVYGFTTITQHLLSYITLAAGICLFVAFIKHAQRIENPVLDIRLFRENLSFLLSNLACLCNYGAAFAVGYLVSIYFQTVRGYPADLTGLFLIFQPAAQAVVSPFIGRLADRKSPFMLASIGTGLTVVALVFLWFIEGETPLAYVLFSLFFVGFGIGIFASPNNQAILSCVSQKDYGMASSILNSMRNMGHITSLAIITIIMNLSLGRTPIAEADPLEIVNSMRHAFIVFSCLCTAAIFLSLKKSPKKSV